MKFFCSLLILVLCIKNFVKRLDNNYSTINYSIHILLFMNECLINKTILSLIEIFW